MKEELKKETDPLIGIKKETSQVAQIFDVITTAIENYSKYKHEMIPVLKKEMNHESLMNLAILVSIVSLGVFEIFPTAALTGLFGMFMGYVLGQKKGKKETTITFSSGK